MEHETIETINRLISTLPEENNTRAQLENFSELYEISRDYLADLNHNIAFIGNVGAGKTTAICHLLGLIHNGVPLLSTGSGRTTLCEVQLKSGSALKVELVPHSDKEVYAYLLEFAQYLMPGNGDESDRESFKLSAEVDRALRNMLDLKCIRKDKNGNKVRIDKAKVLAGKFSSAIELFDEFKRLIMLDKRTVTRHVFDGEQNGMSWMHETFKNINSGLKGNVSLPKKMILTIPDLTFTNSDVSITIVDTKGVDQIANRHDLDSYLNDDRTICVLCTRFNDAPDKTTMNLLDFASKAGLENRISLETILLILERNGEAKDVMDYDGTVANTEDGREVRIEQVTNVVDQSRGIKELCMPCFDAKLDSPCDVLELVENKVTGLRKAHIRKLNQITEAVNAIERELTSNSSSEAKNDVRQTLEPWIQKSQRSKPTIDKYFKELINTILGRTTYAASVRASVNRDGDWHRLDYYQILAVASRSQCVKETEVLCSELNTLVNNMLSNNRLQPAYMLLEQIKNTTDLRLKKLRNVAYLLGRSAYQSELEKDTEFWKLLNSQWGKGPGYKQRVASNTNEWFLNVNYSEIELKVVREVALLWDEYVHEIKSIVGVK
ncbi:hypothetical protein TUM4261_33510 [Shewanella sp. c952]|uniref:hypothetical protein n=1 Tax=Shewanella sp. c952 TaxID=2815913 RepID=UPI001BB90C15|nr:hypothetical protein [Shewanella sp. c952]GIU15854.1 hypothetical protein TUM4261_33510 [Shewanella sp. c952]